MKSELTLTLLALSLAGAMVAVSAFTFVMLRQRSANAPRLGTKGLRRARALADQGMFSSVEPLLRWLSARVELLVPVTTQRELERLLKVAGDPWGITAYELVGMTVLATMIGTAAGVLYSVATRGGILFVIGFGALGAFAPRLYVASIARDRVHRIQRALPHFVDLLVLALGAGLDFPSALRQVVEKASCREAPVVEELAMVLQELKLGRTRQQALGQLAERVPCDSVRDLVAAAIQSEEQGTPLGFVLQTQATTSRQRRSTMAEEAAAKAGAAMIVPMVLLFFAIMILIGGPIIVEAGPQLKGM